MTTQSFHGGMLMSKVKKKRRPPVPAKFAVRGKVRVKRGVKDVDYPDMPLGGWTGTICKTHQNHMYTVRWTQDTLDAIHPVFEKRCEQDSTDFEGSMRRMASSAKPPGQTCRDLAIG